MPHKQIGPIDRLPIICAAGKSPKLSEPVADIFKEYPEDEVAKIFLKQNHGKQPISPTSPIIPESNRLKEILAPDLNKSRFLEFKDQFYDKLYCKKVPLGKPTPTNSKPEHITNVSLTFGKANEKSEKAYNLALPNRCPLDVMKEYVKWHEKYKISHGSYFPSEQIVRKYNDKFDRDQIFGESISADKSGAQVKRLLQDTSPNPFVACIVGKPFQEHIERQSSKIGKPLRRQIYNLQPGMTFGRASLPDEFNVKRLLKASANPEEIQKHSSETTYRLFANDLYNTPIDCRQPAGQNQSPYPKKGQCKFFTENLGEETSVKELISPSIPLQFGLSHRDFLLPRQKNQIRQIFTKAGFDLSDDVHFEKVWSLALTEWTSIGGSVSVEAFKFALDQFKKDRKE